MLRSRLPARLRLSDPERSTLAEIGRRLGRDALERVTSVAKHDTTLAWYSRLIARKFGSSRRAYPGRPPIAGESEVSIQADPVRGWNFETGLLDFPVTFIQPPTTLIAPSSRAPRVALYLLICVLTIAGSIHACSLSRQGTHNSPLKGVAGWG